MCDMNCSGRLVNVQDILYHTPGRRLLNLNFIYQVQLACFLRLFVTVGTQNWWGSPLHLAKHHEPDTGTSTSFTAPEFPMPRSSAQKVDQLGDICLLVEACRLVNVPAKPFGVYVPPDFVVSGELESSLAAGLDIVLLLTAGKIKHRAQHHQQQQRKRRCHALSGRECRRQVRSKAHFFVQLTMLRTSQTLSGSTT